MLRLIFFRTTWFSQPYTKGSYTSIGIGASQEDIENIAQPLYSNPHQSKVEFYSMQHKNSNTHILFLFSHRFFLLESIATQISTVQFTVHIYVAGTQHKLFIDRNLHKRLSWKMIQQT